MCLFEHTTARGWGCLSVCLSVEKLRKENRMCAKEKGERVGVMLVSKGKGVGDLLEQLVTLPTPLAFLVGSWQGKLQMVIM